MNPISFSTRQLPNRLLLVGALEVETCDIGPAVNFAITDDDMVVSAGDFFVDGFFSIEVVTVLIDITHLHCRANGDLAAVRRLEALEHPEQCGLTGAVRADDAHDASRRK